MLMLKGITFYSMILLGAVCALYGASPQSVLLDEDILLIRTEGVSFLGSGITEDAAKTLAINDAKRTALEQAGTYLEANTEILNYQLVKDEIITFTGGMLKLNVIAENRDLVNDMFAFKVEIEATIDTKLLDERIAEVRRDRKLEKQLQAERERNKELEARIAELQASAGTTTEKDVMNILNALTASEWFDKAYDERDDELKVEYYTKAIQLDPEYYSAYNNRGIVLDEMGRYSEALRDYDIAIALYPLDADYYVNRGVTYHNLRRYEDAIREYDIALTFDEESANTYRNRGVTQEAMGRLGEAIWSFNQSIRLDSTNAELFYSRGNVFKGMEQYEKALADFDQAIFLDPTYAYAYFNRGVLYEELGHDEEAANDYNRYLEIHGNQDGDAEDVRQWIRDLGYEPEY